MLYGPPAVDLAMRIQEIMLRAMSGELSWLQAPDILGFTPRTMRRWRSRYELYGYDGLLDRRRGVPSPRRAAVGEVARVWDGRRRLGTYDAQGHARPASPAAA